MDEPLVIFGTGAFAQVVLSFLNEAGIRVEAFTADASFIEASKIECFEGVPVVPFEMIEQRFSPRNYRMFVCVGYSGKNMLRKQKVMDAKDKGYRLISFVHPTACVSRAARYGENCLILEHAVVQPHVEIGHNVFLWTGAAIFHHTVIEDNCFIGGRSVIAGFSRIGAGSFVGTNATIRDCVDVPAGSIVGAGAVLLKSPREAMVHRAGEAESISFDRWKGKI